MFNKIRTKNTEIKSLAKVIADLREGIEDRDALIRELQDENAVLRQKRARLADEFMQYKHNSVYMPKITVYNQEPIRVIGW